MKHSHTIPWLLAAFAFASCATIGPLPMPRFSPEMTLAPLPTSRCQDGVYCACRPLKAWSGEEETDLKEGEQRFELRLFATDSQLWVEVEGRGQVYKPASLYEELCYYVDLPPGEHTITFHGKVGTPEIGLKLGFEIREYGPRLNEVGPFWYDVFSFSCNGMNVCTDTGLAGWAKRQQSRPGGVLSSCSSARVMGLRYSGDGTKDSTAAYEQVAVRFDLQVTSYAKVVDPTDPACQNAR